jgi:hypothetical protein
MGIKAEGLLKPWRLPMNIPIMIRNTGQLNIQDGMKNRSNVLNRSMNPNPSRIKPTMVFPDF